MYYNKYTPELIILRNKSICNNATYKLIESPKSIMYGSIKCHVRILYIDSS